MKLSEVPQQLADLSAQQFHQLVVGKPVNVSDSVAYQFIQRMLEKAKMLTGTKLNFDLPANLTSLFTQVAEQPTLLPQMAMAVGLLATA